MQESIKDINLGLGLDSWEWIIGPSFDFSVACTRTFIDDIYLGEGTVTFNWNNFVPIKINVFGWKLSLHRLPTKDLLFYLGVQVQDMDCVNCEDRLDSINHVFFSCALARGLWRLCGRWCNIDIPECFTWSDWSTWISSLRLNVTKKKVFVAISLVLLWSTWTFRNSMCFAQRKPKKGDLFHSIVVKSFLWISNRDRKASYDWVRWLCNPLL